MSARASETLKAQKSDPCGRPADSACRIAHPARLPKCHEEQLPRVPLQIKLWLFRNSVATVSTLFLSTSTEALSLAMAASSSTAESAFNCSASLGLASSVALRTTGAKRVVREVLLVVFQHHEVEGRNAPVRREDKADVDLFVA